MTALGVPLLLRRYSLRGLIDRICDDLRLRHEQGVACRHLGDLRLDALCHVDQHCLVECLVFGRDDCPARLGTPGGISSFVPKADMLIGTCASLKNATSASLTSWAKPALNFAGLTYPKPSLVVSMTAAFGDVKIILIAIFIFFLDSLYGVRQELR